VLTDSHTHLDNVAFDIDREAVLDRARKAGVSRFISVGASKGLNSSKQAIALAENNSDVFATVGIHPCDALNQSEVAELRDLLQHPKVVAVGETGLDFYWDTSFIPAQEKWLITQIELALEVKKPLIIHSRNSAQRCLEILKEHGAKTVGGVFHCYSEDLLFAEELRAMNFLVSFTGVATFKKSSTLRDLISQLPLQQIMLETDAPYLAPEPYRGKRCEPAYLRETALSIAKTRGISLESLAKATSENATNLFRLPPI